MKSRFSPHKNQFQEKEKLLKWRFYNIQYSEENIKM
jgi:hypothetical protein